MGALKVDLYARQDRQRVTLRGALDAVDKVQQISLVLPEGPRTPAILATIFGLHE